MDPFTNRKPAPEQQDGAVLKENTAMNIGQLKKNASGNFIGKIQTATIDLVIGLRPVNSANPGAPRYDAMVRTRNGVFIPAGGLWEKVAGNGTGVFLQGQIDDPSFEAPLSIALFTQQDGSLNVVWSRPRRRMANPFDDGAPTIGDADTNFSPRSETFASPSEDPFASATGDYVGAEA